jgi:three-Cys-motif partner protein
MPPRDPERYTQGDDGLIVEKVGSWAVDKLEIVTDYVFASGGARKKYAGTGAAYIDPFCGPGRSLIRDTTKFIDGSPIAAFKRSLGSPGRFTSIDISDADEELLNAATKRLSSIGAPVRPIAGPASAAVPQIVRSLDQYGLHLAFLDPHNLATLSFDLFEELAKLKRIDIIAHVSVSDLQRNAARYADEDYEQYSCVT